MFKVNGNNSGTVCGGVSEDIGLGKTDVKEAGAGNETQYLAFIGLKNITAGRESPPEHPFNYDTPKTPPEPNPRYAIPDRVPDKSWPAYAISEPKSPRDFPAYAVHEPRDKGDKW